MYNGRRVQELIEAIDEQTCSRLKRKRTVHITASKCLVARMVKRLSIMGQ